jgi:hypothetical protein
MGVARTARAVRLPVSAASDPPPPPDPPRLPSRRAAAHTCCTRCRHAQGAGVDCDWLHRRVHVAVKGDARQRPCSQADRAASAATARTPMPMSIGARGVLEW